MSIFADNPVLRREVRSRLRLRRVAGGRPLAWAAGLAGAIIAIFYVRGLIAIGRGAPEDARELWSYLILFLLLLVVILTSALLSTAITQEREQQTWDSLAATNLTGPEVLLGKWLARLSLSGLPAVVLLPFLIGCAVKGEIPVVVNLQVFLFLALTAAAYGVLGLLCSFFTRKSVTATVVALSTTLFLCVGTALLATLFSAYIQEASAEYTPSDPPVLWFNPFYALYALIAGITSQEGVGAIRWYGSMHQAEALPVYCLSALLVTAGGLLTMALRFPAAARDG